MRGIVAAVSLSPSHTVAKQNQSAIRLLAGLGVEGDVHAGATVRHRYHVRKTPGAPNLCQVHLIHAGLHDELRAAGFDLTPGEMGENVTTRGLDLLGLPTGTRLRLAAGAAPEEFVPVDLIWTDNELDAAAREVQAVGVPAAVRDLLGLFLGQLDFCRRASDRLEYQTKDTLHLAGRRVGHVCTEDCPLDKSVNLCTQTESGVSPRAGQALLHFAQALAYFRGRGEVGVEDARAVLPWVLHDKLPPNPQSAFFQKPESRVYLTDRVSWLWQLFDRAIAQHAAHAPTRRRTLELAATCGANLGAATTPELRGRLDAVRDRVDDVLKESELNAVVHSDLVLLKDLFVRCRNELDRRESGR